MTLTGRQPRSAGMRAAQRVYAAHLAGERSGVPAGELLGATAAGSCGPGLTRRELLGAGAGVAAGIALTHRPAAALARAASRSGAPRIAIVGAGLAGLRCAHMLWNESPTIPLAATVLEAEAQRAGGRCWTLRDYFADGLETEHGGSFLNSNQTAVRDLAAKLGLREEVVSGGDLPSGEEVFYIGGALYTLAEAQADWEAVGFEAFRHAAAQLSNARGEARLDALSVPEWLDSTEIGASSRFGRLMMANTVTENGGDPAEQSALDLIELLAGNPRSSLLPLPGDDERFHIVGGNDQLVSGMLAELPPETVRFGHVLGAVRQNADRSITLSFDGAAGATEASFDYVVFALPFSTMREADLSRSGLEPDKLEVIRTMGMGTNAKIHLEVSHKTWPALGYSGATYGEWQRLACGWDDTVALGAGARPALYLAFPGGRAGDMALSGAPHGPAPADDVAYVLAELEHVFAGTTAAFTGRAYEDHWAEHPFSHGAYSYYRVGQAANYGALAARSEARMLFAGEHTSIANIGFLDGAVETGERAARELLRRLA